MVVGGLDAGQLTAEEVSALVASGGLDAILLAAAGDGSAAESEVASKVC
jgi:hypothetical protein